MVFCFCGGLQFDACVFALLFVRMACVIGVVCWFTTLIVYVINGSFDLV